MALKPEIGNELRSMVREVLREALAQRGSAAPPQTGVETLRLADDRDLAAFIARITAPGVVEQVRSGAIRFTLGKGSAAAPAPAGASAPLTGVITEQKIEQFRGAGTLVLAPGAVITPLARDRARSLGLKIERRR